MQLNFKVEEQTLTWVNKEKIPVADSVKYLTSKFNFSDEWTGISKTATFFTSDGKAYSQILVDDGCEVPHEVIKAPLFKVSVAGGDLITTNIIIIGIVKSGYVQGETPKPPTPDVYSQILNKLDKASPTKTSELTNDSGFITEEDVPTKTSQLENDNFYITDSQFQQQNSQFALWIGNLEQQFTGVYSEIHNAQDRVTTALADAEMAMDVALGRAYACSFNNYEELINWFNSKDRPNVYPPVGECQVGQNIYIVTLNVPDLWISSVEDNRVTYNYTTDEDFINELNTNGFVRVGKFKFSALETQKVDLTEYATKEEVGDIKTALDNIIAIQNEMIGGDTE